METVGTGIFLRSNLKLMKTPTPIKLGLFKKPGFNAKKTLNPIKLCALGVCFKMFF